MGKILNYKERMRDRQEYAKQQIKREIERPKQATLNNFIRPDSTWIAKGTKFDVGYLRQHRMEYARQDKLYGIQWLGEVFPKAISRILAGEIFTIDSFQKLEYYHYLEAQLNPICHELEYDYTKAIQHNWEKKFCDLIKLCHSMKENGMTAPLDMFMENGHPILTRGYRRLEILFQLGVKEVAVRVWRNEWLAKHFIPTPKWNLPGDSITGIAVKQFIKYGHKATDKYWVHGYTIRYDAHLQGRLRDKLKILELGVKEGMSLDLWRRAFSRAQVYGIDKDSKYEMKKITNHERIKVFNFDYLDKDKLGKFSREHGPFDIIIDDGLHRPDPQKETFKLLWNHLEDNGIYVVEDLHPNYRKRHIDNSAMPTFISKIDQIWTNHKVKSVAFYPNIVFIEKA